MSEPTESAHNDNNLWTDIAPPIDPLRQPIDFQQNILCQRFCSTFSVPFVRFVSVKGSVIKVYSWSASC